MHRQLTHRLALPDRAGGRLNGRRLRYPRGKTLGGCSSINGMIYMRGQSRDYDEWARLTGDDTWRWGEVLPAFRQHEDHFHGADEMHGAGGEWRVEKQRLRWDILDAFARAAEQAGVPASADFNRGNNEGVGYFQVNQRGGWRWNTAKAFLRPRPRQRAPAQPALRGRVGHRPELPEHRGGSQGRSRLAARHAAHRRATVACTVPARGMEARRRLPHRRGTRPRGRRHRDDDLPPGRHGPNGGLGDPMAVLDSRLHVVDASAMPTITSCNTNSPTLVIAEKATAWIRAESNSNGRTQ